MVLVVLTITTLIFGCSSQQYQPPATDIAGRKDISGFPYHPLVYNLDLATLAYQLHAQTLIWPFDPYYDVVPGGAKGRKRFIKAVQHWASNMGRQQRRSGGGVHAYRGPGRLAGYADNPLHDPTIYRYDGLSPWNGTLTNSGKRWVEYLPPKPITDQIRDVYMCSRKSGRAPGAVSVARIATNPKTRSTGARDVLLAFEGSTGDKGESGHPASQSLLGFVLLRHRGQGNAYDIHIAFRGSRSGSLLRSVVQANWDTRAKGSPDWITDLGFDLADPGKGARLITTTGAVHRGFAKSIEQSLPNIFACLGKAALLKPGTRPENIFVTGHSLGGGLAQIFVSAMLMGDQYGPNGKGPAMPPQMRQWPWPHLKLITFSAPRAGNADWAKALTTTGLASEFHARDLRRYDYKALAPNDESILTRLTNRTMPAGYRVLVSTDAVSTSAVPGRKPVGKTVYVDKLGPLAFAAPYSGDSHEPLVLRALMVASLNDSRLPPAVWRYREYANAEGDAAISPRSALATLKALQAEFLQYHAGDTPAFNARAYMRDLKIFNQLLGQQ